MFFTLCSIRLVGATLCADTWFQHQIQLRIVPVPFLCNTPQNRGVVGRGMSHAAVKVVATVPPAALVDRIVDRRQRFIPKN